MKKEKETRNERREMKIKEARKQKLMKEVK
jgi:hypothetical protein